MKQTKHTQENTESPIRSVLLWDLPTRLFHWLLLIFVIISFVTGNISGNAMQYHEWGGFAILVLLLFWLIWGFAALGSLALFRLLRIRLPSSAI